MDDTEQAPVRKSMPTFMYRLGEDGECEKQLFDHPDDIPAGRRWVDSPARINDAPERPPAAAAATAASDATDDAPAPLAPPYSQHGFRELRAELKRRTGKGSKPGTSMEKLIELMDATDTDPA